MVEPRTWPAPEIALGLTVHLTGGCDVLGIHHGHDELAEHLDLLDLGQRDFVADLHRLQIAYRRLVPEFKALHCGLFGREVVGLSLRRRERAVEGVERRFDGGLRTLHAGGARGAEAADRAAGTAG